MKNIIICTALLATVSCAPYYVGRKPVEAEPGYTTTTLAQPAKSVEQSSESVAGISEGPGVTSEMSADDWGNQPAAVMAGSANMESSTPAYGFNGAVVDENTRKLHQMEDSEDSRSIMISMYTQKIEENDALENSLLLERDRVDSRNAEILTLKAIGNVDAQEITTLKKDLAEQIKEREELEARLVTAQIRRLQAEKLLLEGRLKEAEGETLPVAGLSTSSVANAGGRL